MKKVNEAEGIHIPSELNIYQKSNFLISGKYHSTLLENKILAFSLAHSDSFDFGSSDRETIKSYIKVNEFKKLLGTNSGSFYNRLSDAAKAMTGRSIGTSSPDSKVFDYIAVVTRATCKDGIFTIEYNSAIRPMLVDLKKNYSRLNLTYQMKFENNYSFRLYELLRQKCYRAKDDNSGEKDVFRVNMNLAELKLELGVVNAELDSVRRVLRGQQNPDYEKAVEASPERSFDKWSEFKRKVLDKAIKEINEVTDMQVEYETVRQGVGGKTTDICFTIRVNSANYDEDGSAKIEMSQDEIMDFIAEMRTYTEKKFAWSDMQSIAEAANWDHDPIKRAYSLFKTQKGIKNPTGWMIKALKDGYSPAIVDVQAEEVPVPRKRKPYTKKNAFNDIEEQDYDFDAIEEAILS